MTTIIFISMMMKATTQLVAIKPKDFELPNIWYVENKYHK